MVNNDFNDNNIFLNNQIYYVHCTTTSTIYSTDIFNIIE